MAVNRHILTPVVTVARTVPGIKKEVSCDSWLTKTALFTVYAPLSFRGLHSTWQAASDVLQTSIKYITSLKEKKYIFYKGHS